MATWLTVINAAHRHRRTTWLTGLAWLALWTILGSACAILFIEGI